MPRAPRSTTNPAETFPELRYQNRPLEESITRLGRKWMLLILRDMAFRRVSRFNQFLRGNRGLTPRVLSRRLREMESDGLVLKQRSGRSVTYTLTERGNDAVYIVLAFLRYGLRYHPQPPE